MILVDVRNKAIGIEVVEIANIHRHVHSDVFELIRELTRLGISVKKMNLQVVQKIALSS